MKTITASTPLAERRFQDTAVTYANRPRKFDTNLQGGEIRIKTSVDNGVSYQDKVIIDGSQPELLAGTLDTKDRLIEIECTGSAVFVFLGDVLYGD